MLSVLMLSQVHIVHPHTSAQTARLIEAVHSIAVRGRLQQYDGELKSTTTKNEEEKKVKKT